MKTFKEFLREVRKPNASSIKKILDNSEDWGDLGNYISVKKGNLEIVDTFYYGEQKALDRLIKDWTDPKGTYAKFFKDEHNIKFKLEDSFSQTNAQGKYKKLTKDGIVGIVVKVIQ